MKILIVKLKTVTVFIAIMAFASFMSEGVFCSDINGNGMERRLGNGSRVMAPGWINIDKQKSQSFRDITTKSKISSDQLIEKINADVGRHMLEIQPDEVEVDIKGRRGKGESGTTEKKIITAAETGAPDYDVDIGSGENQEYDSQGNLRSEEIGGVRHIYVGFGNDWGMDIQEAIDFASEDDIIIIREGEYGGFTITEEKGNGVRFYGGYNREGVRGIESTPTIINDTINLSPTSWANFIDKSVELNGLVVTTQSDRIGIIVGNALSAKIDYCKITAEGRGVSMYQSDLTMINNEISAGQGIVMTTSELTIINNTINATREPVFTDGGYMALGYWSYAAIEAWQNSHIFSRDNILSGYSGEYALFTGATFSTLDSTLEFAEPSRSNTLVAMTETISNKPDFRFFSNYYNYHGTTYFSPTITSKNEFKSATAKDSLKAVFKILLEEKLDIQNMQTSQLDQTLMAELIERALRESALSAPLGEVTPRDMETAALLASIINNPTAEQKVILDAVEALVNEARKLEEETGNEELKKASDDFIQMVATVLLAQALPDLLKEGDMSNIKGMFNELDKEKARIFLEYQGALKMYYKNIVKELAANMTTLQIKDLIAKNLTEQELAKLPANRIDDILDKIRNAKGKTITERELLKKEQQYKEEYLMPAERMLEKNMKTLLQGFTERLFGVLDGAGLIQGRGKK